MGWATIVAAMIVLGLDWVKCVGVALVIIEIGVIGMTVKESVDIQTDKKKDLI